MLPDESSRVGKGPLIPDLGGTLTPGGVAPAIKDFPARNVVEHALAELRADVGTRAWRVMSQRSLPLHERKTLEKIGCELNVTRERVRQIEAKAIKRLAALVCEPRHSLFREQAEALRSTLGVAFPVDRLPSVRQVSIMFDLDRNGREGLLLLLWLAGPYAVRDDWLYIGAADPFHATAQALDRLTRDGAADLEDVWRAFEKQGVRQDLWRDWLGVVPGYRESEGQVFKWRGSLADKAESVLRLSGEPLTKDELADLIGDSCNIRTLSNYLLSDPRFLRRGLRHFGLREWGGEEYSTIVDEIEQEILRRGGDASIEALVDRLTGLFGVSESSVRQYAAGPRFARTRAGLIRVRTSDEAIPGRTIRPIELTRRCYRQKNGWALKMAVSPDTIRGSGTMIPAGFAHHIGIGPLGKAQLDSRYGIVTYSWPSLQPTVGSLGRVVQEMRAEVGDRIFMEFIAAGRVEVSHLSRNVLEATEGFERLALEVGTRLDDWNGDIVAACVHALGLEGAQQIGAFRYHKRALLAAVRRRFRVRGEEDLVRLLPPHALEVDETPLLELIAIATGQVAEVPRRSSIPADSV